jgi:hypothetical protein
MIHKYQVGQLCVVVMSVSFPEFIGRQCTITKQLDWIERAISMTGMDYIIDLQGHGQAMAQEPCLRPVKPGDMPDFAQEETELTEEQPA